MEGGRKKIPQKPKNKKNAMTLQFLPWQVARIALL
jgi:hypothetical protein